MSTESKIDLPCAFKKRCADVKDSDSAGSVRKDAVSPDTIILGPSNDSNTVIRSRKDQMSAVDAVISSSGLVRTPQECKRLKTEVHKESHPFYNNKSYDYSNINLAHMAYNQNQMMYPYYFHHQMNPYAVAYPRQTDIPYHIHYRAGYHPSSYHNVQSITPQNPSLGENVDKNNLNRKESSLGGLCQKFLVKYESSLGCTSTISIDSLSKEWQVGRRRMYDIVNILESIDIMSRKCKNTYEWHGLQEIENTFRRLQIEAIGIFPDYAARNNLVPSVEAALEKSMTAIKSQNKKHIDTSAPPANGLELLLASAEQMQETLDESPDCIDSMESLKQRPQKKNIKQNSLSVFSQRFVQMFLLGNDHVELYSTSALIVDRMDGSSNLKDNCSTVKTTVRRMYDIANVMTVLGFVEKVAFNTNKAAFKWSYKKSVKKLWSENNTQGGEK